MRIVGKIAGYHGLKGEIKVYPLVDDTAVFNDFDSVRINDKNFVPKSTRPHKNFLLLTLEGVNSLTEAEQLNGYIEADLNEDLSDDEIYIDDLVGADVFDADNKLVGQVESFSDAGQKLITIKFDKNYSEKRELLLPFVDQYIIDIAKDKASIKVNLTDEILGLAT